MYGITKLHITLALSISLLVGFFASMVIFSNASVNECAPLSSVLQQMSQDDTINQYLDPECNLVELLVSSETVGGKRVKCVESTRPGDCVLGPDISDEIVDQVEDIIQDIIQDSNQISNLEGQDSDDSIADTSDLDEIIDVIAAQDLIDVLIEDPQNKTIDVVIDDDIAVIDIGFLPDDIDSDISTLQEVLALRDEQDSIKDIEVVDDFDTQSIDVVSEESDQSNQESVLDDFYTDPQINKRIVDGTVFLRSSDPEKLLKVQQVLEDRFGDVIQSIGPLFPQTGLLDDVVVDFDVDELTYQEIVEFLNEQDIFTEYALDTDTNTAVELIPNIKFSSRDDLVSRENSGSYDTSFGGIKSPLGVLKNGSIENDINKISQPNSGNTNKGKEEEYNDATAIIKRQEHLESIGFDAIESCLEGGLPIKVAVIDNGFDLTHEDLVGKNMIGIDVADDDQNVQIPKIAKERNHGTLEAGLIGASHNDFGVKGIVPTSDLILLKSTKDTEHGADITHGIEALAAAYEQGATVVNMSWGGFNNVPMLERVSGEIARKGVQLIAAAGNYNKNEPFFPAAYDRVVGVAAIDTYGNKASFSNYGDRVDISAPGTEIMTTDLNNSYNRYNGTSESAPLVAGVIALLQSVLLEPSEIESRLAHSKEFGLGAGLLDISFLCEEGLIDRELVQLSEGYIPLTDPNRYDGITDIFSSITDTITQDFGTKLFASLLPEQLYTSIFHTQGAEITGSEKNLIRILLVILSLLLLGIAIYAYQHTQNKSKKATNNTLDQ